MKTKTKYHIRWMIRRDMPEVVNIECQSFEFPWYEQDFVNCLRQRNCIGMVVEYKERIIGFMIYELHKTRLRLLNFAVASNYRRKGVGTEMIDKLVNKLHHQRRTVIQAEVRETNLPAQLLFQSQGFLAVDIIKGQYEDTNEDAYLMEYTL